MADAGGNGVSSSTGGNGASSSAGGNGVNTSTGGNAQGCYVCMPKRRHNICDRTCEKGPLRGKANI